MLDRWRPGRLQVRWRTDIPCHCGSVSTATIAGGGCRSSPAKEHVEPFPCLHSQPRRLLRVPLLDYTDTPAPPERGHVIEDPSARPMLGGCEGDLQDERCVRVNSWCRRIVRRIVKRGFGWGGDRRRSRWGRREGDEGLVIPVELRDAGRRDAGRDEPCFQTWILSVPRCEGCIDDVPPGTNLKGQRNGSWIGDAATNP